MPIRPPGRDSGGLLGTPRVEREQPRNQYSNLGTNTLSRKRARSGRIAKTHLSKVVNQSV